MIILTHMHTKPCKKNYKFKIVTFSKNTKEGKFCKCVQYSTPHTQTPTMSLHTLSHTHKCTHIQTHSTCEHTHTFTHRAAAEEAAAVSHVSRVFCMIASTLQKWRWIVRMWCVAAHVGQKWGNKGNCEKKRKNHTRNPLTILNIQLPPWVLSWETLQQQQANTCMQMNESATLARTSEWPAASSAFSIPTFRYRSCRWFSGCSFSIGHWDKMASTAAKSTPRDAQVMAAILKDMGVVEYEPRLINQMLEFTYRTYPFSYP